MNSSTGNTMEEHIQVPVNVTILVLNVLGFSLLSLLVISVSLSQRLHRRDPVVNNFLYTWILLSGLASFDELAMLANKNLGDVTEVREAMLRLLTMVSTLNLSIHLWYIMRSPYRKSSPKATKLRTLGLVVTPYLFGGLPLVMLYYDSAGAILLGVFGLLISVLTPIADVILLVCYWRWYWITRKVDAISGVMSLSFFVRLLAFSIYQLFYTVLLVLDATSGVFSIWSVAFKILANIFPLLAFCVIGLHTDILQLWFPCFWRRKSTVSVQDDVIDISSNKIGILPDDINDDSQHLLEREVGEKEHRMV